MIKMYVKGNLVTMLARSVEENNPITIAHGCNCHDAMHSGIAWELSRNFPAIRNADRKYYMDMTEGNMDHQGNRVMLATHSAAIIGCSLVINLYTQFFPGSDYNAEVFKKAFEHLDRQRIKGNVYIPRIGAGVCGGSWDEIEQIINEATPNTNLIVVDWDGTIHDDTDNTNKPLYEFNIGE